MLVGVPAVWLMLIVVFVFFFVVVGRGLTVSGRVLAVFWLVVGVSGAASGW